MYNVTKIEWTVQSEKATGDKIDLLAEFTDTVNCSGFKYGIKRVYSIKDDGMAIHRMGRAIRPRKGAWRWLGQFNDFRQG